MIGSKIGKSVSLGSLACLALLSASSLGTASAETQSIQSCSHWVYTVESDTRIYDTWSTGSRVRGWAYKTSEIDSFSVGEKFVRVDNLGVNGAWTNYYKTDYVLKTDLDFSFCQ